jgi:hypothetical protein
VRKRAANKHHDPVLVRLAEMRSTARKALAADSNDAEHDALYEVEAALKVLTPEVRRVVDALKLCVRFMQVDKIRPNADCHRYALWRAAQSSARSALARGRSA